MQPRSFYGIPLVPLPADVSRILFVAHLDNSMNGEILYKVFRKYGPLRQVRVSNCAETANTAFVIFENVFDAQRAQEHLNGFAPSKNMKPLAVRFYNEKKHQQAALAKKKRKEQLEELNRRQRELALPKGDNTNESEGGPKVPDNSAKR
jgi:pre-mRNA branch site protein p14